MTVPSQTPRNLSTAAPGATEFPYDFKILEASHLLVQVDGVTKALNVDYTVDGVGNNAGGNVTFLAPLTGGESVLRKRNMPFSRSIDYQQLGDFGSATMNSDQDAPIMMLQQLSESIQRSLRLSDESVAVPVLDAPVPGYVFRWDSTGTRVEYFDWTGGWGSPTGSTAIGWTQVGTGAALRSVGGKLSDLDVSPQDFGAVSDGISDDSPALFKAIDEAKKRRAAVFIPPGKPIRVTAGYVQSVLNADVMIYGSGRPAGGGYVTGPFQGSVIILDSADTASFFYRQAATSRLQVRDIVFKCAQFVQDRSFFEFTAGGAAFLFDNVYFESVEKPIVPKEGCYFQNAVLRDVQFRNSGTIHSSIDGTGETNRLRGTLLVLDNVNHEGTVPANTEKVICDLRGIRDIQGRNFLLEGTSPGSDWIVCRLYNPYDSDYIRRPLATFSGFHSEWTGSAPSVCIDQTGGNVIVTNPGSFVSTSSKYSLKGQGTVTINGASFSGVTNQIGDYFTFEDARCKAILNQCSSRGFTYLPAPRNITINNGSANNATSALIATPAFSNDLARLAWKFDGGFIQAPATVYQSGGTTNYPSTDATYGRKLVVVPSSNAITFNVKLPFTDLVTTDDVVSIVIKAKLPTFTAGTISLQFCKDNTSVGTLATFDTSFSAATVEFTRCVSLADITTATFGVQVKTASTSGMSGNWEYLCFEIWIGSKLPKVIYPTYPNNVITYASAAPTSGSWNRGDRVLHSVPAVGSPKGWICTVAGTPGTWVSEGNL